MSIVSRYTMLLCQKDEINVTFIGIRILTLRDDGIRIPTQIYRYLIFRKITLYQFFSVTFDDIHYIPKVNKIIRFNFEYVWHWFFCEIVTKPLRHEINRYDLVTIYVTA